MNDCRQENGAVGAQTGAALLEVLIAILVLSIGVLGLAALQAASLQVNNDAYFRSQATFLAYDISDRMRTNRSAAINGDYDVADFAATPVCDADAGAPGTSVAADDLAEWANLLACYLPNGAGTITRVGDDVVIRVRWREAAEDDLRVFEYRSRI